MTTRVLVPSTAHLPSCDVVIPARNAERFIAAAIQSILDQTLPASGIIVVDDRSTDGTARVAAGLGARVRVVGGTGRGAGAARNLGVGHSRSALVAFLDADDVCGPQRLLRQAEALAARPDAALVFCDADYADASGAPTGVTFTCPEYRRDAVLGLLFERNRVLTASAAMVRRSAFDAVGGFDETLAPSEDYDLWLRLARFGAVEHIAESLLCYRLHDDNLSGNRDALRRCERDVLRKHAVADIRAALLTSCGDHDRAAVALSRVLFRMERYREGEALLRSIRPVGEDRALVHFLLGNFAVQRQSLLAAADQYERCLACDPGYAPAHNNLGAVAVALGRPRASLEHFIAAAAARPGYADPVRNIEALRGGHAGDMRYTVAPLRAALRPDVRAGALTPPPPSTVFVPQSDA